ncbi:rhomboid family intramembrane serine protease [Microbacterium sp.]|uniref:rhomboid family intramembrane serine protease n=2 Tax=Microbacterium sp. TaxID=51671 RepID=UPI001AD2C597|nr:rhomboid family intramembrane serine protease [Microbacterium sp.]MBN9184102.1 rhomboid family intramembrane serine protease [Microbacterium sp.]MBN9193988.1 rhomboid family intramembrane serine protease [Microbacterium sp.]
MVEMAQATGGTAVLRRYPVTIVVTAAVTLGFALQWFLPLADVLQRDPQAIGEGQWWRVLTSVFVQGSGWGQYIFNTLGMVVVGAAVERTRGSMQWLAAALVAQLGASIAAVVWAPAVHDSGSSLVVGGLVGMLTVTRFVHPTPWAATAAGYRVFFLSYLAALALGGPVVGAVTGSVLTGIAVAAVIRSRFATWALTGVLAVVVAASVVLVVAHDQHGVAALLGLVVALVVRLIPRGAGRTRSRPGSA